MYVSHFLRFSQKLDDFVVALAEDCVSVVITMNRIKIPMQQKQKAMAGIIPHLHDAFDASGSQSRQTVGFLAFLGFV